LVDVIMKKLLIATFNPNKAREYQEMLSGIHLECMCLKDFPNAVSPLENGKSLEENALIKARYAASFTGLWSLGDDTGLEVFSLGGAPGIYSARYAGPECNPQKNNRLLLENLKGKTGNERKARFVCSLALVSPVGKEKTISGITDGMILEHPAGSGGFGYDSLFLPDGFSVSYAEMSAETKNSLSHRFKALKLLIPDLKKIFS